MSHNGLHCFHSNIMLTRTPQLPEVGGVSHRDMIRHLTLHTKYGHKVPVRAWKRLHRELKEMYEEKR